MNLVEQFGYEKAKDALDQLKREKKDLLTIGKTVLVKAEIEQNLLEYRRQHNIFEVWDIAVNRRGEESKLLKIWRVDICLADKRMSIADYDADGLAGWSRFHCLRHATDAEIKAGHRL